MTKPPYETSGSEESAGEDPALVIAGLREQIALLRSQLARAEEVSAAADEHIEFLEDRAQVDRLMGIGNRERLEKTYRRLGGGHPHRRQGEVSPHHSAIILDIDRFKSVNDTYGHPFGDVVLREVAGRVQAGVRDKDTIGRFGGEEIVVLLEDTDPEEAWYVAERLRSSIEEAPIGEHNLTVTASFGVGPLALGQDLSEGISLADQALYVAKDTGRNRIIMYSDLSEGS